MFLEKRQFRVSEGILCAIARMCYLLEASSPFPPTERVNSALWPHPNWSVMSAGKISRVWLQVVGSPCWLRTDFYQSCWEWGTDKVFRQQSLKMLKMASESFNHTLLLFLGFFLNNSLWVPLETNASTLNLNNNGFLGTLFIGTFECILNYFYFIRFANYILPITPITAGP